MPRFTINRICLCLTFLSLTFSFTLTCVAQKLEHATTQTLPTQTLLLKPELIQINSASIEFAEHRPPNAQVTIVFENGLMLDLTTWQAVAAGLKQCCNLLFYNRPGVGRSTRGDTDLSLETESARLFQFLKEHKLSPPYILVGHSLGGQYAQAYAKRYPEQVNGLVLVDALPLGVAKPYHELPWYTRLGLWLFASKATRQEIANIEPMGKYVMEGSSFYNKSMIRIIAQSSSQQHKPQGLIKDLLRGVIYAEDFGVWALDPEVAEERMNTFYPHAEKRTMPANHRIQEQYPEVVIDAILSVMNSSRSKSTSSNDVSISIQEN